MGRKKKKPIKPWCWYCNREFDDDKILIQHQRAKHYKCPFCHKKLYSGPGLTVHCIQVHKETLDRIPEALPNRNSVDIDIYGMQGIPEEDVREHERLKRGSSPPPKPEPESKSQQSKSTQQAQLPTSIAAMPPNQMQSVLPPNPMQAAMFQQAMGMPMPPSFPIGMPPMFPPGFIPPPGFIRPPGFIPPPGFPPMAPPTMLPGMPMPMQMPPMMPPTSMGSGYPPPPPPQLNVPSPPPPPQLNVPSPPPPPQLNVPPQTPPPQLNIRPQTPPPQSNVPPPPPPPRPASLNSRIMHPNKDLSLEEIRLSLSKYSKFVNSK